MPAFDTQQVHSVGLEAQIVFVAAEGANESSQGIH